MKMQNRNVNRKQNLITHIAYPSNEEKAYLPCRQGRYTLRGDEIPKAVFKTFSST